MVDLEATFEKIETELKEVNTNNEALKRNYQELSEYKEVMMRTQAMLQEHSAEAHQNIEEHHAGVEETGYGGTHGAGIQLGFVAGCIAREKIFAFERCLWLLSRGNVFIRNSEIPQAMEDPMTGDPVYKSVFICYFQGEQLKARVKKMCEGFKASLYPCPDNPQEREQMLQGVNTRLVDLKTVLAQTSDHRHRVLVSAQKEVRTWIIKVEKIKAIYHTLNMFNFEVAQNSLIAECWSPRSALDGVYTALRNGEKMSGSTVPSIVQMMQTKKRPPTYFRTNRFTSGFQGIVDAYGIASYGEVNPALYTIITFPFLFAVMFGDAGHGTIMFLFGLYLVVNEKRFLSQRSDNEIWNTFLGGRYIIMMMGLFSIYTGMIYNDIFAKSFNIFGSAWVGDKYDEEDLECCTTLQLDPKHFFTNDTPYPFGLDPVWQPAKNKIAFLNSLKMKLAVILGISQMFFGICLSFFNHLYFRKIVSVFCEFIPEIIFLGCLFGYLVGLIFYKWVTFKPWESECSPALLIHYINMFMMSYSADAVCPQKVFYPGQQTLQTVFVLAALVQVPILLLVKPFYERAMHKKHQLAIGGFQSTDHLIPNEQTPEGDGAHRSVNSGDEEAAQNGTSTIFMAEEEEEEFEFGEVFIHQAIHTIEFCLGCISHTASYLRLWALSLAHAQLSEVLWTMVLHLGLAMDYKYLGCIPVFILWFFWANLTVAILLLMEGLSAFLHTLRLHWVEFQSKFYEGDGVGFLPFTFKELLKIDSLEDLK